MNVKRISNLEYEVINILWIRGECTIRDVFEILLQNKKLAYTTVATILKRLLDKGLVVRNEKNFVIHYSPKISKAEYSRSLSSTFFSKFFQSYGDMALASFAESIEKLPKDKKKHLLGLLENNHENK